jgi:uncharacterized protein YbjT (DUF2867 family)
VSRPVLVLGADGFIGRHIAFALRRRGREVIASARDPKRLARMGFRVVRADLTDPSSHAPGFWRETLAGADLVNAAGLLTGSDADFEAVHVAAPRAAYAALGEGGRGMLISAVGIEAATPFARWRREGEAVALASGNVIVLRPGLVVSDTSYGGSSLLRALAALPFRTPVIGSGAQRFNPVHADDLAEAVAALLETAPDPGAWEIGGAERLTQAEMLAAYRGWLGLAPVGLLTIPLPLARALGRLGDALRLGPVSATSVAQLEAGVEADEGPLVSRLALRPRGLAEILAARPAGTQDLWQVRLYLLKPLVRLSLAALWLVSGLLGLLLPASEFLPLFSGAGLSDPLMMALARGGGVVDLALAAALIRNWRPRPVTLAQLAVVGAYTVGLSALAPALWLAPMGGLLKNLAVLALLLVHLALVEER